MQKQNKTKGFTLIELLVVIAVIGLLASTVMASLTTARTKSRDARRMGDMNQIQKALELYNNDHGKYPPIRCANTSSDGGNSRWYTFLAEIEPYLSEISGDPRGHQNNYRYYYDSNTGDNHQSYGLMMRFESSGNFNKALTDGGYFQATSGRYFEMGTQPSFCMNQYTGADRGWWCTSGDVCLGGN